VPVVPVASVTTRLPGAHLALGGGAGLAHFLIRLFIWHEMWRLARAVWHVPTFGPFLVVLVGSALVALMVWRQQRGAVGPRGRRWRRRVRRTGSGVRGYGTGAGPRDW